MTQKTMFKPMEATSEMYTAGSQEFPLLVTPKVDGIRALKKDGVIYLKSMKRLKNKYLQEKLSELPDGLDFEITGKGKFSDFSGTITSEGGVPDLKIWVFDCFVKPSEPYKERIRRAKSLLIFGEKPSFPVVVLSPVKAWDDTEVTLLYDEFIAHGYEGAILRKPDAPYKFNRATKREGSFLKLKPYKDSEAIILEIVEGTINMNPPKRDEKGRQKRSLAKAGLKPSGTLGSIRVRDIYSGVEFKVSASGLTDVEKQRWFDQRKSLVGKLLKYKFLGYGEKDKPRHGQVIGLRDRDDLAIVS